MCANIPKSKRILSLLLALALAGSLFAALPGLRAGALEDGETETERSALPDAEAAEEDGTPSEEVPEESSDYGLATAATYASDEEFEASIADFPESYKTDLRKIHALYPNWIFKAHYTGTNWADAVEAECELGVSLISSSSISSWKSTQDGAYNWSTGTWVGLDGSSWVQASPEIVAYYMDPRNYLDSNYVFAFFEYGYDADTQTKSGLEQMVAGSFLAGTYTENGVTYSYVDQIMKAAAEAGMNPYLIATTIIQEQGINGTGACISGTVSGYEGYYNFFNIGAYATSTMSTITRGMWYAAGSGVGSTTYSRPWNTRYKSILGGAQFYVSNYVANNQNTLYTKKFNVFGSSSYSKYTHQYMTNVRAVSSEAYELSSAYDDSARSVALVFDIPVYDNMPESSVSKPTGTGSVDNRLASLTVSSGTLTPSFGMYTYEYDLLLSSGVSSVTVSATKKDSTASISGTGTYTVASSGVTTIPVVVTAQNGTTRTYTIYAARSQGDLDDKGDTSTGGSSSGGSSGSGGTSSGTASDLMDTSLTLSSSGYLSGVPTVPVTVSKLKTSLGLKSGVTATVKSSDGSTRSSTSNVCTGDVVTVTDGTTTLTYTVVIYGDLNGDGDITALDLLRMRKYLLGSSTLTAAQLKAADATRDGSSNAIDLLRIQKYLLGTASITQ